MVVDNFEICNSEFGYIVEAHIEDDNGMRYWVPLRNFGQRQSDAMDFCHTDCPKLNETSVKSLARSFDRAVTYKRVNGRRFVRTSNNDKNAM